MNCQPIPKKDRKKILFISDDIRTHSGVAHVARDIVKHSAHYYNWVLLSGGMNDHPQKNTYIDYSSEMGEDASVVLYPCDEYGNIQLLMTIIDREQIDAILFITDPRSYQYIWDNARRIRKKCSLNYLNLWDNYPVPQYNQSFYNSCDSLLCINQVSLDIVKKLVTDESILIDYVPHGVDETVFFPIEVGSKQYLTLQQFKKNLYGKEQPEFTVLFNSRNIRRKCVSDLLHGWKLFIDKFGDEQRRSVKLVIKTERVDPNGTDLPAVEKMLFGDQESGIIWVDQYLTEEGLNLLYNATDCTILPSSNEGWGLSLLETMHVGNPIIATLTGGMQDQMRFEDEAGNWAFVTDHTSNYNREHGSWAFPILPSVSTLLGSPPTPYIFDDKVSADDIAQRIYSVYYESAENRTLIGAEGRAFALGESGFTASKMAATIIKNLDRVLTTFLPKQAYELTKI